MSGKPPRLCGQCGTVHSLDVRCARQVEQDRARRARHDQHRPSARERGYDTAWDKARAAFLAAHPWCYGCGQKATTVDHVIPHRGDHRLFWDKSNWQPLCNRCHNSHKQREERRAVSRSTPRPLLAQCPADSNQQNNNPKDVFGNHQCHNQLAHMRSPLNGESSLVDAVGGALRHSRRSKSPRCYFITKEALLSWSRPLFDRGVAKDLQGKDGTGGGSTAQHFSQLEISE